MSAEQSYPSPSAAQVSGGAGPFFNQNGGRQSGPPPQIPNDLQQLQAAETSRNQPAQQGSENSDNGGQDYTLHAGAHVAEDALRQAASQETLAQHVMSMTNDDTAFQTPDGADQSSRKRSKVSRACDECRRKKIRCDATEAATEPCTNCRRTQARCQFSRTPMKRGPSKGYIKELADKINTLESRLGPPLSGQHEHLYSPYAQETPSDSMDHRMDQTPQSHLTRKRTHSMSDRGGMVFGDQSYAPARAANWSSDSQRRLSTSIVHPQTPGSDPTRQQFSPRSGPFKFTRPEGGSMESISTSYGTERDAAAAASLEWDESVVDEYYRIFQPTFPLLPHSKVRLRARLANCPVVLRDAFLVALDCAVRSSPSSTLPAGNDLWQATKRASDLISSSQYETSTARTMSSNLIYIQTLVLMALETDNHGPATMRGQVGPPRAEWLGRAIGVALHLKLNVFRARDRYAEGDPDADEKLGRRVWWILFILDRWQACSASSLPQLADNSSALWIEDQMLLGENAYHLTRLSYIIGHLSSILQESPGLMSPSSPAAPIITSAILGEIDRFRESVETLLLGEASLVHLAYWHVRLLVHRLAPATTLHELLIPAARMASILNNIHTTITPLNHHFAALAALTLVELADFDETKQEAEKGIENITEALSARKGLMSHDNSAGWDSAIRDLITHRRTAGERAEGASGATPVGLQHLADAAIGGKEQHSGSATSPTDKQNEASAAASTTGAASFDPMTLTRLGYLAALAQEKPG